MNAVADEELCWDLDFLLWCSPFSRLSALTDLDFPLVCLVLVTGGEPVGEDFIVEGQYIGMVAYRGPTATL